MKKFNPRPAPEIFDSLLTIDDMCKVFARSPMTIFNWRRQLGMPSMSIPSRKQSCVRFYAEEVEQWAKEHNKVIVNPSILKEVSRNQ